MIMVKNLSAVIVALSIITENGRPCKGRVQLRRIAMTEGEIHCSTYAEPFGFVTEEPLRREPCMGPRRYSSPLSVFGNRHDGRHRCLPIETFMLHESMRCLGGKMLRHLGRKLGAMTVMLDGFHLPHIALRSWISLGIQTWRDHVPGASGGFVPCILRESTGGAWRGGICCGEAWQSTRAGRIAGLSELSPFNSTESP